MKRSKDEIWSAQMMYAARFSVDCKMFGAYCYLSEIRGTIPLLHGPLGCAFFPKLVPPDSIRTQFLGINHPPPFPCTNMDERDIIYGGADKLRHAIMGVDEYYKPELIGVIVSCPAAIIADDIVEIVSSLREKTGAEIIYTPSSAGFSDDERMEDFNRHADDLVNIWKNPDEKPKWGIEKCGRLDTLYSLIEQLVEYPSERLENTVNIDTYGRFHFFEELTEEIAEIKAIMGEIGIHVNTVFPGCSVGDIKKLASAKLNFMRRSEKSAKFMKEKFGTEYVFDLLGTRYMGINGAKRFYIDIAEKFDLQQRAETVIKEREREQEKGLREIRQEIKGKKIAYICLPLYTTPEFLELLEMFGLDIKIISINTLWWRRWGMSQRTIKKLLRELPANLMQLHSSPAIYADLPVEEEVTRIKEKDIDLIIGDVLVSDISRAMFYENHGIKSLNPYYMGYSSFRISFSQTMRLGKLIAERLKTPLPERKLLYLKYRFHPDRFPSLMSDLSDELRWEKIMNKVWRDDSEGCGIRDGH